MASPRLRRRGSLAHYLETRLVAIVAVALAAGFGIVLAVHAWHAQRLLRERLAMASRVVASSIRHDMELGAAADSGHLLAELTGPPYDAVRILRPDGSVFRSSRPGEEGARLLETGRWETLRARASASRAPEMLDTARGVEGLFALENETSCHACHSPRQAVTGYVQVSMSFAEVNAVLAEERWLLGGTAMAVGLALVLALRRLLRRRVLDRLGGISAAVEHARRGELEVRVAEPISDEIGALAARLNEMMDAIEKGHRDLARQTEQLDRLAAIGQLTAGILHELKNGLGGLKLAARAATARGADDRRRAEYLAAIGEQADRLERIVRSLVGFSKPSHAMARVDVNAAVTTVVELVERTRTGSPVRIQHALATDLPAIAGDATLIEQTLLNLCLNARDARAEGLVIEIDTVLLAAGRTSADAAPFGALAGRDIVRIRVADNGPGIDASIRARLFHPFATTKAEGTGLGLSICHRIVLGHGGTIEAAPRPGGGTVFTILLPACCAEAEPAAAPAPPMPAPMLVARMRG